jgi:2-dehydropantoate 2-reductase
LSWLVNGVGAIGTYIGGSLILQGQKVAFLERPESIASLRESGLRLYIQGQDYRILHPNVFSDLKEALEFETYDVVIFALKSFDTQSALEMIRPFASQFPPVLCLQNGVENEPALEGVLGKDRVIAGTVTSSVRRVGVGDIVVERTRGVGVFSTHPLSMKIAQALSRAHLNAHQFSSPASMKWSKMLTNLLANASAAILDMPPAQILEHPGLYQLEIIQLREAISVMHASGIPVIDLPGVPVRIFASAVDHLPPHLSRPFISRMAGKGRGEKMPSFHIDLYSGRGKSEVDFLNGAVVRFGQRVGVATPVNNWLCQTLLDQISGSIPRDEYSHQPEKLLSHVYLSEEID